MINRIRGKTTPALSDSDKQVRRETRRKITLYLLPLYIVASIIVIFIITSSMYSIEATSNLDRYQAIIDPYISDQERLTLKSRIAQIHTRSDFILIVNDMKTVSNKNTLYNHAISVF